MIFQVRGVSHQAGGDTFPGYRRSEWIEPGAWRRAQGDHLSDRPQIEIPESVYRCHPVTRVRGGHRDGPGGHPCNEHMPGVRLNHSVGFPAAVVLPQVR
jgi:hypothetical protein